MRDEIYCTKFMIIAHENKVIFMAFEKLISADKKRHTDNLIIV